MKQKKNQYKSLIRSHFGWKTYFFILLTLVILVGTALHLKLNFMNIFLNLGNLFNDIYQRMFPPDFSNMSELALSMLETVEIAIWGTFFAIIFSIPLAIISARNIARNSFVYYIAKVIIVFFRAVPEFILAMFLVISVGFGAMSGILALALHTMGFLAKFYAEEIEHVDNGPIEALKATGATKSQIFMFSIVPQVMPSFIAYNLYILDRNVRMATVLGIVGAGGIGYELISSFRMFKYQKVTTIIIIIFITIFLIDLLSGWMRKKIHVNS